MMIIDSRLRPPFAGIEETMIFDANYASQFSRMFRQTPNESVLQRSMELLIQEMDAAGITKGFVPVRNGINNEALAAAITQYKDRFYGFANVTMAPGERSISQESLNEIDTLVINGPLTGISMEPGFFSESCCIDNERIFSVYEKCEKNDIPVILTSNVYTPEHFSPTRICNVIKAFPKLRLILVHACIPWTAAVCQLAVQHPNLYISPDCYLLGAPGHRDFIDAANTLLPNQILFGSAYPLVPLGFAVDYYLHCGLRDDVIEYVMHYNALRALGEDVPRFDVPYNSLYGA